MLEATLKPGERAVIAGHSMGGIAITSWSERYPRRVTERADAVALINTTTGDLLHHVQLMPVPPRLTDARVRAAGTLLKTLRRGAAGARGRPAEQAVRVDDGGRPRRGPAVAEFIYELFTATPPASRGGWARALVDALGTHKHIGLQNLTVPTLVIGSEKDRLLPMVSSRHIARTAPNLAEFVELSGGHCAILERPDEVNRQLRWLVESVGERRRSGSDHGPRSPASSGVCTSAAARRPGPHGAVEEAGPLVGGFGACPEDARRRACAATARRWSTTRAAPPPSGRRARNPLPPNSGRRSRSAPPPRCRTGRRTRPVRARGVLRAAADRRCAGR